MARVRLPRIYKINLCSGHVGLIYAKSKPVANRRAICEWGANVKSVESATPEDVEWVRAMGGNVPEIER